MCGISGILLRDGEIADERLLGTMAHAMRRRGPDAQGILARGRVGLAHRRLRILDLSDQANQPLFNEDGKLAVVFNGEIYNHPELKSELEALGHHFRTRSDTEVIVHAFEQWGSGCFRRFNGMFALGIWDGRGASPELWLARDRFGTKPLFLGRAAGRLAFASELKPLLEVPWLSRELDRAAILRFLKFSHVPSPGTIFREIEQLPPGSWFRSDGEHEERGAFRSSEELLGADGLTSRKSDERPEAEWLSELEGVLNRCVRRQLVSDVPVGCFLSGGVDSSLLAFSYASLAGASSIETFSIGYRETEFDETGYARQIAKGLGARHHELIASPDDYLDLIPEIPDYFDQPFADPTSLSMLLLARFARERVTVALSGDGGDELFFGYAQQLALLRLDPLLAMPGSARRGMFSAMSAGGRFLARLGVAPRRADQARKLGEILSFREPEELLQGFIGTIGPLSSEALAALVATHADGGAPGPLAPALAGLEKLPVRDRVAQAFVRSFLVDTVLAKTDRATMAFGLEGRVPFLDDEMADFSARLPFRHKVRGSMGRHGSKYLLRRLLERKLSEKGLSSALSRRPKQGFSIPLRDWLRHDLRYLLQEYLNDKRLARDGIFAPTPVSALVREHIRGYANHSHLLWSLISFQMWKERYLG